MAYYSDIVTDDQTKVPRARISITVLNANGTLATLTDNAGGPITQPIVTNKTGFFSFNATDAVYTIEFRFGGRLLREDEVIVGLPPEFIGPPGSVLDKAITNAKLANMPANTIKGAIAAGSPVDLTIAQVRGLVNPTVLSPLSYGCKCDGVTDDSVAFATLVAAVNATTLGATIVLPAGIIKLSAVTFTFTKPLTIFGQGVVQSQIICYNNARLFFDGARAAYGTAGLNTSFAMRDISVLTDGIHSTSPIHADYSPSTPAGLSPTLVMENVFVGGRNSVSGFQIGIQIVDCPWPRLTNVVIVGDAANDPAYQSGYGIKYTGGDGSPAFRDVRVYNVKDAIWCEGEMEGVVLDGIELVAVTRGVTYKDTTNGFQPLLSMTNCHINATEYDIKTVGVSQFAIGTGNLLYGNGAAANWTAVDITPSLATGANNALVVTGRVSDLTISGATSAATTKTGIRVRGTATSIEDFQILANRFESLDIGVQLDTGTNGVFVGNDNSFRNVVTPHVDNGDGNFRERKMYMGSVTGVTSGSGVIAITFPTSGVTFTSLPIVMATGGDSGGETYNVINSTVSSVGFSVQVANAGAGVGAGQTRRINYIAGGY